MDRQKRLLDLIGQIYDAALDDRLWVDVAPTLAQAFESTSAAVQIQTPEAKTQLITRSGNIDESMDRAYCEHYHETDVWYQRAVEVGIGKIVDSRDLIADNELERTEFFYDWCRRVDQFYIIGCVFPTEPGGMGALGIHRPHGSGNYDDQHKALAATVIPHLQRALHIRRRFAEPEIAGRVALDVLDRSGTATVVVSREGRILYANREAEGLLQARVGITSINSRLATGHRATTDRMLTMIRGAVDTANGSGTSAGGALAIVREDRLPLTLLIAPFRPGRGGVGAAAPAAIVFIRDPERPTAMTLALQGLFGLTPAEACIAGMLAGGKSVDDVAAQQRITLNTLRVHLKNIFAKTGTARQAQLVALILRSVATIAS